MKILVTGGAGFIGSHVVRKLIDEGMEVVVLDSFVSGSESNIPQGVLVLRGDIRDMEIVQKAAQDVTGIVHLAALVSVPISVANPGLTEEVNVEGTKNIFQAARELGVRRVVYASSAAVYGNEPSVPKSEGSILKPESPYAASKLENERSAVVSGISTMGLRFFNVYGPGQTGSHAYASVIPRWMEAVRDGREITVYGDGSQTRDFVHVSDVASAVLAALSSKEQGVVNVASGTERSLKDVLDLLSTEVGRPLSVAYLPPRAGDILRSYASIESAREKIDFKPTIEFQEGIRSLMKNYGII